MKSCGLESVASGGFKSQVVIRAVIISVTSVWVASGWPSDGWLLMLYSTILKHYIKIEVNINLSYLIF